MGKQGARNALNKYNPSVTFFILDNQNSTNLLPNLSVTVDPILQVISPNPALHLFITMSTIRNKRTVKQLESRPPPLFLELPCFCGLIFTESQKLNSHMFQEHIHSQEFQKMKSITQQLSVMKHLHRSSPQVAFNVQTNQSAKATGDASFNAAKGKKQNKRPRKPKNADNNTHDFVQSLGFQNPTSSKSAETKLSEKKPPHEPQTPANYNRSESEEQSKQNQLTSDLLEKQPRRQQVRQFYNSRIFMCGECLSFFIYSAELNVHVSLNHSGEYPDGSIFGLKKHEILSFFKLPCEKPLFPHLHEREKRFRCGCGTAYAASSSLVNHIKLRHNSVAPVGTQGLPHTKRIKQFIFDGDVITFAS